jgi:hypothetical protein
MALASNGPAACRYGEGTSLRGRAARRPGGSAPQTNAWRPITPKRAHTRARRGAACPQGAPGGDFSELAAAIAVYLAAVNATTDYKEVSDIFNAFMRDVATEDRPFYYVRAGRAPGGEGVL